MSTAPLDDLDLGDEARPWDLPTGVSSRFAAAGLYLGNGSNPLEVAVATSPDRPAVGEVKQLWEKRKGKRASPLLSVVVYRHHGTWRAAVCGPAGEDPRAVMDLDIGQTGRVSKAGLAEPDRHAATRFLFDTLPEDDADIAGLRNVGMFATHHLRSGVPQRSDWDLACDKGRELLGIADRALIEGLGFAIERRDTTTSVLRANGTARAIAVFLQQSESPEGAALRYGGLSPAAHALAAADRETLPYALVTRGRQIRVYAAGAGVGVGRKGRAETFVELNLAVLPEGAAGYLPLVFGADALRPDGTFEEILDRSRDFATGLGERLRERVYEEAVPALATAIASRHVGRGEQDLEFFYEQTLVILFRLLFVAYAEDKDLLPYRTSGNYSRHALKTLARDLADRETTHRHGFDPRATDLWTGVEQLFRAVELGNEDWGVPRYNGSLFASEGEVSLIGAAIAELELTNAEFGPPLTALLVDRAAEGHLGPVDFRSLSVREFGTIYEGLLESSLAVAPKDLAVARDASYVSAEEGDDVEVREGETYIHDRSGARKATGSYFTKPFAVEHLLDNALEPALDAHLRRLETLMDSGDDAAAGEAFFDFRCADIAMGSGHFLVAAVDRIEARLTGFLAERPVPAVVAELERLRKAAIDHLGDLAAGVEIEQSSLLRRQVARRCVYGVDRNPVAVELARLAVWIHTFVPGLPLSFLDRTLVCGDSLTGIGTLEEAVSVLDPSAAGDGSAPSLYRERIEALIDRTTEALGRLARASDADAREVRAVRNALEEATEAARPAETLLDLLVAVRLGRAEPIEEISEQAIVSHPRGAEVRGLAKELRSLHFPTAFPEVFLRDIPGFDCLVGNPPWEELTVEKSKWWNLRFPGLRTQTEAEQRKLLAQYEETQPLLLSEYEAELAMAQSTRGVLASGPYDISGGDPDLYKYFAWRFWQLVRTGGTVGVVLPQGLFAAKGSSPWRNEVLTRASALVVFCRNEQEWLFDDVNPGYTITLTSFTGVRASHGEIKLIATVRGVDELSRAVPESAVEVDPHRLKSNDPELCLPRIETSADFALFRALLAHPGAGQTDRTDFEFFAATDLHATNDRGFFKGAGDPVFNHLNIGHLRFVPDVGNFAFADLEEVAAALHERRLKSHRRRNSPFGRMSADWNQEPETLPLRHPRIAIRDVVHATNPRKVWSALLPANTLVTNKAPYLVFVRGGPAAQAYLLGMLGSSVCDWFGHLRVVLNLNFFILNALPVPVMKAGDPRVDRLVSIAASLALADMAPGCDGWEDLPHEPITDEHAAVAELDALASLLYGVDESFLPLIWAEDHRTRPTLEEVTRYRSVWGEASAGE